MPSFKPLPGFPDGLPEDARKLCRLEGIARQVFSDAGYREIRPPIVESQALFERSSGATSDVVQKQMFAIPSRDGADTMVLRPEGTPGVFRAYLEAGYAKTNPFQKFFYLGPMFRYERPQKGRTRQFDQYGIEAIGSASALLDAEVLSVIFRFYREAGLRKVLIAVNAIGCPDCRPAYLRTLREALAPSREAFCELCRDRLERNILRLFDCKAETCRAMLANAPAIGDSLCDPCRAHDGTFRGALDPGLPVQHDPRLVRGLDYYTRTAFEVLHEGIGARGAVGGGGRYDHLGEAFGGPHIPAVGYAVGVVPTLLALEAEAEGGAVPAPTPEGIFVACVEDAQRPAAFRLAETLRGAGIAADIDYTAKNLKGQMRAASGRSFREVWILGPDEAVAGTVKIKRLSDGSERALPVDAAVAQAAGGPPDAAR